MSPVTKAMVEAYALMIMVMGTFFIYFCGMVWAFCNPVLSSCEEDTVSDLDLDAVKSGLWPTEPNHLQVLCTGADPERLRRDTTTWLTQTYVHFGGDTDSLLLDRNHSGFADQVRVGKTRASPV